MRHRPAGQRGIALVAVLWVTLLLGFAAAAFLREARTGVNLARNTLADAKAEALADAGIYWAMMGLLATDEAVAVQADGRPYRFSLEGGEVRVTVQNEAGKIDLNQAPADVLQSLFAHAGAEAEAAAGLAAALEDFRDSDSEPHPRGAEDPDYARADAPSGAKDAPLAVIDELRQVLGVTPELYARVEPLITVHSPQAEVDLATAPAEVLRALPGMTEQQVRETLAARQRDAEPVVVDVATIIAEAAIPEGGLFVRRAVVRRGAESAQPFDIVDWRRIWPVTESSGRNVRRL